MNLLSLGAGLDISSFCSNMAGIVQIIGYVLLIVKVAIPLLIIALGIFDFGKAVVAEKEDEIKKQTKRLIFRVIAGIIIFLIPNIVTWIFGLVAGYEEMSDQVNFQNCETCFISPWDCDTTGTN